MPGTHLAHERVPVVAAALDVVVDPDAQGPVVLPGQGPEPAPFDEELDRTAFEGGDLGEAVTRLPEADDLGVVGRPPEHREVRSGSPWVRDRHCPVLDPR